MTTNILNLPLLRAEFEVADNEGWRDGVAFVAAGSGIAYPAIGNTGNGIASAVSVTTGLTLGEYSIVLTGPSAFRVVDPDGATVGAGTVGTPFGQSGFGFTINAGTTPFAAGDTFVLSVLPQPIDLTGIAFSMQVRRISTSATVLISGSTVDGRLVNSGAAGLLTIAIPQAVLVRAGASPDNEPYALDILAQADGVSKRCLTGTLALLRGVTHP